MSVVVRKATQRRSVPKVPNVHKVKYRYFTAIKLERRDFSGAGAVVVTYKFVINKCTYGRIEREIGLLK